MNKAFLIAGALIALFLVGCAKTPASSDQSKMGYDSTGRIVAQDQDGNDFNMEAKDKASHATPSTNHH